MVDKGSLEVERGRGWVEDERGAWFVEAEEGGAVVVLVVEQKHPHWRMFLNRYTPTV